jgi:hypothetical protein
MRCVHYHHLIPSCAFLEHFIEDIKNQSNILIFFEMIVSLIFTSSILYCVHYVFNCQIPLGCVSLRYLMLALSSPSFQAFFATKSSLYLLLLFFFWFSVLVVSKIAIGLGLVRYAGTYTPATLTQHSRAISCTSSRILYAYVAFLCM